VKLGKIDIGLLVVAVALVGIGSFVGLAVAPAEEHMGDVYRIIYVHVPSAWVAMVAFLVNFGASLYYLFKTSPRADALAEASAEIGVVFCALLLVTGSIWGKPTWGVWWTWDPRLTSAAIMFFAYSGYLALRHFVDMPEKRATWASVVAIIIAVDVPIVWFSVKWWNSLHQQQSVSASGSTDRTILYTWMFNAVAFLVAYAFLVRQRYFLARQQQDLEAAEPPSLEETATDAA